MVLEKNFRIFLALSPFSEVGTGGSLFRAGFYCFEKFQIFDRFLSLITS